VSHEEIEALRRGDDVQRFRSVQQWRRERRLPRYVSLVEGDNLLPLDLDNCAAVDALVDMVAQRPTFRVLEMLPGPDELVAVGPEGRFCHELVVPFVRKTAAVAPARGAAQTGCISRSTAARPPRTASSAIRSGR
jgi:hypothetical protein